jgi:transposase
MKKGPKMKKYRVHSAEFKAGIVQEIQAGKSPNQVAREHHLSPALVTKWREKSENGEGFTNRPTAREKQLERELELYKLKVAEQALALDLLKKAHREASQRTRRSSGLIAISKPLGRKSGPVK